MEIDYGGLMERAIEARRLAYAPYSRFKVGAALLAADGEVYCGCNIENAAFTPGCCAERTAFFKAVSDGKRDFLAIAVAGAPEEMEIPGQPCPPCGVCRQVMAEFCDPKRFEIILGRSAKERQIWRLEELLPMAFGP